MKICFKNLTNYFHAIFCVCLKFVCNLIKQLGDETETKFRGKINFSLKYSKTTNCLFVKINKCRQLLPMDNGKSSDPFVEMFAFDFFVAVFFSAYFHFN
jgi:hypothetical protein